MAIILKISGFEDLLNDIAEAGGSINKAADSALRQSAQIMQTELKSEMQSSNVPGDLVNAMPPFDVETSGNRIYARVGYKKGSYNPDNISDGYKVVFLNYGTPNRKIHGQIHEGSGTRSGGALRLGFIQRAKKKAKPKMQKAQKAAFDKILERLKNQ